METQNNRRDGKRQTAIRLSPAKIKALKQYALDNDTTVTAIIEAATNKLLESAKGRAKHE